MQEVAREDPWHTLVHEHPAIVVRYRRLAPGVSAEWRGTRVLLSTRLDRVQRRCALMHELVHVERGVGWPDASAATMQREEAIVRREAALRLVPLWELAELVAQRGQVEPITAWLVAEEFDVTIEVAIEAMWMLGQRDGLVA